MRMRMFRRGVLRGYLGWGRVSMVELHSEGIGTKGASLESLTGPHRRVQSTF